MAYVPLTEDEKKKQLGGDEQQGSEQVLNSGESSQAATGPSQAVAGGGGAAAAPKAKASGSGWTNLQQYVTANEGNDTAMGTAVQGKYNDKQAAADQTVKTYGQTAQKTVADNTVADNGVTKSLATSPTQVKTEDFTKALQGWKGPNSADTIEGWGDAGRGVQDVQKVAGQAQDFEGRRGLLQEAYKEPRYSAGEQRLDSFLVGAGEGGQKALQGIDDSSKQFGSDWDELLGAVNSDIGKGRDTSEATKTATTTAYQDAVGKNREALTKAQAEAARRNESNTSAYSAVTSDLKSTNPAVRARALTHLGIDPAVGEYMINTLGIDPAKFVTKGTDYKLGDIASQTQADDWGALSSLAGAGGLAPIDSFDFGKSGADGKPFSSNQGVVAQAGQAKALQTGIQQRAQAKQNERLAEVNAAKAAFRGKNEAAQTNYLRNIGVDPGLIAEAKDLGIDLSEFIGSGAALNTGDVATDAERGQWSELLAALGGSPGSFDLRDSQNEGSAYNFNTGGYRTQADKAKADRAAKQAEAAAAAAQAAQPEGAGFQKSGTADPARQATGWWRDPAEDAIGEKNTKITGTAGKKLISPWASRLK